MSGPNPIHSSDGPCGFETQGRRFTIREYIFSPYLRKNKGHHFSVLYWPHRGSNSPGGLSNINQSKRSKSALLQIPNEASKSDLLGGLRNHKTKAIKSLSSNFHSDQSERSSGRKRQKSPFASTFLPITPERL